MERNSQKNIREEDRRVGDYGQNVEQKQDYRERCGDNRAQDKERDCKKVLKLVVDTNVIISGLIKDSISRKIIFTSDLLLFTIKFSKRV